jgi:hypothetical protein
MMKFLISALSFSILLTSCGKQEEIYLYTQYDSDYQAANAAMQAKCKDENKIFSELDKTSSFASFFNTKNERIFKIQRKKSINGSNEVDSYLFVRMHKGNLDSANGKMVISIASTESNGSASTEVQNKRLLYTQKNNKDILDTVATGVCSTKPGTYSKIGSWNTESLTYTQKRELIISKDPDRFVRATETLTLYTGLPAFLHRYIGTVYNEWKRTDTKEESKFRTVDRKSITELSADDCNRDNTCLSVFDNTLPLCELLVDTRHYDAQSPDSYQTSYVNCGAVSELVSLPE